MARKSSRTQPSITEIIETLAGAMADTMAHPDCPNALWHELNGAFCGLTELAQRADVARMTATTVRASMIQALTILFTKPAA